MAGVTATAHAPVPLPPLLSLSPTVMTTVPFRALARPAAALRDWGRSALRVSALLAGALLLTGCAAVSVSTRRLADDFSVVSLLFSDMEPVLSRTSASSRELSRPRTR